MLNDKHMICRLVVLHLTHASYAYKNYWLCDRSDRDFMLKKSAAINDVKTRSSFDYTSNVNWRANSTETQFTKLASLTM